MRNRKLNRLPGFDYSREALYFVTSCVNKHHRCLGYVKNDKMILNEYGAIAQTQWDWLQKQYPYAVSHVFVVMPNHIHAILEIDTTQNSIIEPSNPEFTVGTCRDLSLSPRSPHDCNTKIKSLSELMGAYKTTVSKQIHLAGMPEFQWQRSFYDRIIRDHESYCTIYNYIENNPLRWENDDYFEN
jgi:putative transposase